MKPFCEGGAGLEEIACGNPNRRLRKMILAFPPESRAAMLGVLAAEPRYRAEAIRRLCANPDSREVAELLMDLEAERRVNADVIEALTESLKG